MTMCRFVQIILIFACLLLTSCLDDAGLLGRFRIALTDSPLDADKVKGIHIIFTNFEAKRDGAWKSLRSFDQPVGVNFVTYSGGKSFPLVDDYIEPGEISELRFSLNVVDPNSSLVRNPLCNIEFTDGTSKLLYLEDGALPEIILQGDFGASAQDPADFTFDFDMRKSIYEADGKAYFKPFIRVVETPLTGNIEATMVNTTSTDRIVVYTYKAGAYNSSEASNPARGEVQFKNAITSVRVVKNKFTMGFLEQGSYDLIFTRISESGALQGVLGKHAGVAVTAQEALAVEIDLKKLTAP